MNTLLAKLRQWFGLAPSAPLVQGDMGRLLQLLGETPAAALSCENIHQWVDLYAEAYVRGEDVAHLMPLVQMHLQMCPDCAEEFEALLAMMAAGTAAS